VSSGSSEDSSRRPDAVKFEKSPKEDALRRDFTVNPLSMDSFTGAVIDHVGGHQDAKDKLLRAVGDPHQDHTGSAKLLFAPASRYFHTPAANTETNKTVPMTINPVSVHIPLGVTGSPGATSISGMSRRISGSSPRLSR
jgi:hypothetical protein